MWRRAGARLAGQLRRARNSAQDAFQSSSVSRRVLFAIGGGSGAYGVSLMLTALGAPSKDAELLKKGNQAATEHDDDPEAFEKAGTLSVKTFVIIGRRQERCRSFRVSFCRILRRLLSRLSTQTLIFLCVYVRIVEGWFTRIHGGGSAQAQYCCQPPLGDVQERSV